MADAKLTSKDKSLQQSWYPKKDGSVVVFHMNLGMVIEDAIFKEIKIIALFCVYRF